MYNIPSDTLYDTFLTAFDIIEYGGKKPLYGWHISDLKIYDTPRSLNDFGLNRPPQSWCYVSDTQVLISIQPKWCELILRKYKTVEVRKSKPKLYTPFNSFIYMTKPKYAKDWHTIYSDSNGNDVDGEQMVVGEFVCDKIYEWHFFNERTMG